MAEEFDLIGRIRMIVQADGPGSKRSIEEIASMVEQTAADLTQHLIAQKAPGSPEELEKVAGLARAMMAEIMATVTAMNAAGDRYINAGISQAGRDARAEGKPAAPAEQATRQNVTTMRTEQDFLNSAASRGVADVAGAAAVDLIDMDGLRASIQSVVASNEAFVSDQEAVRLAAKARVSGMQREAAILAKLTAAEEGLLGPYADAKASLIRSNAVIDSAVQERLAGDDLYLNSMAEVARFQQQINAKIQERLAGDDVYLNSTAEVSRFQQQIKASVQERLAGDDAYLDSTANLARFQQQIKASVQERLASDAAYLDSTASLAQAQQRINAAVQERLSKDVAYLDSTAELTRFQEQIKAAVQQRLAKDNEYIQASADTAVAQNQIRAKVQERLAGDTSYITSTVDLARAQERIKAQTQTRLASDSSYVQSSTDIAAAQQHLRAQVQTRLAREDAYIVSTTDLAVAQQQIKAQVQGRLAGDTAYIRALADSQTAQQQINNKVLQQHLSVGSAHVAEVARGKTLQARLNNEVLASQIGGGLADVQATAKALQAQLNAQVQAALVQYPGYVANLAVGKNAQAALNNAVMAQQMQGGELAQIQATAKAQQALLNVEVQRQLLTTPGYVANLAEAKALQQRVNNEVLAEQLRTGYADAQAVGKSLQEQINAQMRARLASDQAYIDALASQRVSDRLIKTRTSESLANNPLAQVAFSAGDVQDAKDEATRAESRARNNDYLDAEARTSIAKREEALAIKQRVMALQTGTLLLEREELATLELTAAKQKAALAVSTSAAGSAAIAATREAKGQLAAANAAEMQFQRVVQLRALTGLHSMQNKVATAELESALQSETYAEIITKLQAEEIAIRERAIAMGLGHLLPGGGARGPGKPPGPQGGAGAGAGAGGLGLGQGLKSTLRFGIASFAIFGVAREVSEAVRETVELEKILNQVERQFANVGESGAEGFQRFRSSVFEIAQLTGENADDVAQLGFQLQGAFGGNTTRALEETRSAIMAVRVTGLELNETIDAFTALTQSFEGTGNTADETRLTIMEFSDIALQLQENLGVLAKETISFSADLAPVAAELGFTADQLAVLGAVSQKFSGRSGASLAEAYGRILPQIRESAVELSMIFSSIGGDVADSLNEAFAQGDIEKAFMGIIANYNRLGKTQQGQVIDLLGGRREAAAIIPLLRNGQEAVSEFGKAVNAEGKTVQYFNDLQDTLQQRLARLDETWKHMVTTLFESGLKDFFADLVGVVETLVDAMSMLVNLLGSVTGAAGALNLGGPLASLAEIAFLVGGTRLVGRQVRGFRTSMQDRRQQQNGGAPVPTAPHTLRAGREAFQAQRATGKGVARSLASGFAAGPWAAAGLAAATVLVSNWDQGVKEQAAKAAADIEKGGISRADIKNVADAIDFQGDLRDEILNRLKRGETQDEIANALGNMAEDAAGWIEQGKDWLPWEASGAISSVQAQATSVVKSLFDEFDTGVQDALDSYAGGSEESRREVHRRAKALVDEQLGAVTAVQSIDPSTAAAVRGQVLGGSTVRNTLGIDNTPTLGEILEANEANLGSVFALKPGQLEILRGVVDEFGADIAAYTLFSEEMTGEESELERVAKKLSQALAAGTVLDTIDGLRGEQAKFSDATNEFINAFIMLLAETPEMGGMEKAYADAAIQWEEAAARYEAGLLSLDAYERALNHYIDTLNAQKGANPETDAELADALAVRRKHIMDLIERETGVLSDLQGIGGGTGAFAEIERILSSNIVNPDLGVEERGDIARQLIENMKARQQALADAADSEEEADRILAQRLTLPENVRKALTAELVASSSEMRRHVGSFTAGDQQQAEDLINQIVEAAFTRDISLQVAAASVLNTTREARIKFLQARIAGRNAALKVKGLMAKVAWNNIDMAKQAAETQAENEKDFLDILGLQNQSVEVIAEIERLMGQVQTSLVPGSTSSTDAGSEADKLKDQLDEAWEAFKAAADARLDLQLAMVEGDPVAEAQIAQQQAANAMQFARNETERISAAAAKIRADRQLQEALVEITNARSDLYMALVANDPVAVAQEMQRRADHDYQQARGEAEQIAAQAARLEADRSLLQATHDIWNSQVALLKAQAEYVGDTVAAARLGVQEAKNALNQARAMGAGVAEQNRLKADLINAQAAARDALLSDRQEEYRYLHDMEKITTGQLIGYLQGLLAIPDLTKKQIQDINLQIKNLRDELGQDFQFNLPTQLALPTAYEVRRFNQSTGDAMPGGYNDNRNISVTVNATTNADPEQIASAVASAVGDPSRNGTVARRY